jgi:ribosomal protein L37E
MEKFCPQCGSKAPDHLSKFCDKCGGQLPAATPEHKICLTCGSKAPDIHSKFCDKCGSPLPDPEVKICSKCGSKAPDIHSKFCDKCGSPVIGFQGTILSASDGSLEIARARQNSEISVLILAFALVLGLVSVFVNPLNLIVIIIVSAAGVYYDAKELQAGSRYPKVVAAKPVTWNPKIWGLLVLVVWIVGLPLYLIRRKELFSLFTGEISPEIPQESAPVELTATPRESLQESIPDAIPALSGAIEVEQVPIPVPAPEPAPEVPLRAAPDPVQATIPESLKGSPFESTLHEDVEAIPESAYGVTWEPVPEATVEPSPQPGPDTAPLPSPGLSATLKRLFRIS